MHNNLCIRVCINCCLFQVESICNSSENILHLDGAFLKDEATLLFSAQKQLLNGHIKN